MEPVRSELETRMADRVRAHFKTTLGGAGAAVLVAVGAGAGTRLALGESGRVVGSAIAFTLAILAIPIIGGWSTFRNLRCPACDRSVALATSYNYSLFSGAARRECPSCGATIFADSLPRGTRQTFAWLALLGAGVAAMQILLRSHGRH